ncbi:MAG: hypothetical protein FD124_3890 [Alphaproteobacteria bacterium]|nr:MAG: hypothetical protein FD124_3890 [Alphaproteobacteria bacterium]
MSNLFDFRPDHNDELEGETRRDAALTLLRVRRAVLIRELQAAALRVALDRGAVCADDVRALVPIPVAVSPKVVGAAFRELADTGILCRAGFINSKRPQAHARPLTQWQLADAAGAAAWLAAHSPLTAD